MRRNAFTATIAVTDILIHIDSLLDATISISEPVISDSEGKSVQLCAEITDLPGMLLGDIIAEFVITPGDASMFFYCIDLCAIWHYNTL